MEPFLRQTNRKVDKVLGDGNCLFRAFAKQTTGRSEDHACLRNLLIKFEEMNPDIFRPLVSTIDPPTTFENHLKQNSVWGTTIEIFAAATMFGVDVYEATDSLGAPRWMVFRPRKASLIRRFNNGMCFNKKWVEILTATMITSPRLMDGNFLGLLFLQQLIHKS